MPRWILLLVFLLAECLLPAQYPGGGYPPGQSPGGGYPPGQTPGGLGIPWPRRGKQSKTAKEPSDTQPRVNLTGVLRSVDAHELILEAQDTRIITVKLSEKTKFSKNSADAQATDFKPGDRLSVEATQDDQGYFYAVTVTWQKAGTSEERARASQPTGASRQKSEDEEGPPVLRRAGSSPPDEAKGSPKDSDDPAATEPGPPPTLVRDQPLPVKIGEDDPGPPVLRHGAPVRRAAKPIEPPTEIELARVEAATPAPAAPPPPPPKPDPAIDKARLAAATFDEKLPNYICQQFTARFESTSRPADFKPVDIVFAEVIYEDRRERYRNIKINGKQTVKSMEESGGSWSTGEYGTILADLFSPATAADFRQRGGDTIAGVQTTVYDFSVDHDHSHWSIHAPAQMVRPAYGGSVWIDRGNGRVMRIEMQARHMPAEFPFDTIESAVDYQYVRLGGPDLFLLPVRAEVLSCQRGASSCSRNIIDFRNYHKYSGEASITFGP